MDKTININLGGTLFQIDEDAFRILKDYLQAINNRFANIHGGHETIEDIESRMAEILLSQKGLAGVVTKENVESMISIIGKPEDFDLSGPELETSQYTTQKKRMYRNPEDKILGGVCSGIATYLDTDPVLIRILFVLMFLFFGVGFFVYIGLWIALPEAKTDSQKRLMYGNSYNKVGADNTQTSITSMTNAPNSPSKLGSAINEVFRALGRVFYIFLRVFLIILGVMLVLTGFLAILSFLMLFIFKYPGVFSIDSSSVNLFYFRDFLNFVVNPSIVPWILGLTAVVIILPMIALIYWGVKMIFWFRARDGVISLVAFVVWVISVTALVIIGFNEGISFAETGKTTAQIVLPKSPDTLYVYTDHKIADLKYEKQISLPHEEYSVFLNEEKKELYIRPYLSIDNAQDGVASVEIRERSTGRNEIEAIKKTEELLYNYSFRGDSLKIDEYFTIPSGRKWSADEIGIHLYIPTGTILKFDEPARILVYSHFHDGNEDYSESLWKSIGCWKMTQDGLEPVTATPTNK